MESSRILLVHFAGQGSTAQELKSTILLSHPDALIELVVVVAGDDQRLCHVAANFLANICFFFVPDDIRANASSILRSLRNAAPGVPLLLVIGAPEEQSSDLLDHADDFVLTPFRAPEVVSRLRRWTHARETEQADIAQLKEKVGLKQLIGTSAAFVGTVRKVPAIARSDASVMIQGETGTGKEVFARATHYLSARARGPFLPVNCGAIPTELMENELFGHAAGAYTGAISAVGGLVKECHGGTLFLDEVDALPVQAQVKLLRFLQEKEFRPLGAHKLEKADVRVIAASNTNIHERVTKGQFREDLFYRLNVLNLYLPPLRDRQEDIAALAQHFLARLRERSTHAPKTISPSALHRLQRYSWPGNVRELENVLERSAVFCCRESLESADIQLSEAIALPEDETFQAQKARVVAEFEESYLRRMLAAHENNISQAARAAGKDRRSFWELMRKYNLHHPSSPRLL